MRSVAGCAAVVVVAALGVTAAGGCRSSSSDARGPSGPSTPAVSAPAYSTDDIAFLQKMFSHTQQAVDLCSMVHDRSSDAQLIALAGQICGEQRSEFAGFRAQLLQSEAPLSGPDSTETEGTVDEATVDKLTRPPWTS